MSTPDRTPSPSSPPEAVTAAAAGAGGSPSGSPQHHRDGDAAGRVLLGALFLLALALRPQIIGLGPLLPRIQQDLDMSHALGGLVATLPVVCMGAFAPLTPFLVTRWRARPVVTVALLSIGVFGLLRSAATGTVMLVALTVLVGVPIGIAGAVLPVVVKEAFARRPVVATGVYSSGIVLGAAISGAVAVPLARTAGGWRGALAVFSIVTLVLAGGWAALRGEDSSSPRAVRPPSLPLRSGVAWLVTTTFALQSAWFYGLNVWLPAFLIERGWDEPAAGSSLGALNVAALAAIVAIPALADRHGSRRIYLTTASAALTAATVVIVVASEHALPAIVVGGASIGVLLVIGMTLPLDVEEHPERVAGVVGLMLGFGYATAAFAPWILGAIRDATGTFSASMWTLAVIAAVLTVLTAKLSPSRLTAVAAAAGGEIERGSGR